jgi:hypothetical protein
VVEIYIEGDRLHLDVQALDKLWSLRSHLEFPLEHVTSVRADAEAARGWWHGVRLLGTQVPGILTAGAFYENGGVVFYDVHDPDRTIVLELNHERYARLVVEVQDPAAAVKMISAAIAKKRR